MYNDGVCARYTTMTALRSRIVYRNQYPVLMELMDLGKVLSNETRLNKRRLCEG